MQINNEKFKLTLISQATRNFIIVISRINNNYQYITIFTSSNNNISTSSNYTFSTSFFYNISIFSAFLFISINSVTSIFVNKLIIDSTTQEIRLSNTLSVENVEIELKRTLNYYAKFRLTKNFSINSLIDFVVLFNCNSIVVKIALTLFVKAFFTNFHESKLYKKAITDAQHKIN